MQFKKCPQLPTSWGEVVDKMTILEIKLSKIKSETKLSFIKREFDLISEVAKGALQNSAECRRLKDDLLQVNQMLWNIEDQLRIFEKNKNFNRDFVTLARSVYFFNDRRAKIKANINNALESGIQEMKDYVEYDDDIDVSFQKIDELINNSSNN